MFEVINNTNEQFNNELVMKLINKVIELEKIDNAIFNVIIVDNKKIKELNREYRGIDKETDVISFALEDNSLGNEYIESFGRLLGDIYISYDKVKSQAEEYGHSIDRELCFLIVHGLLHLLGYDHMNKVDEEKMFKRQEVILDVMEIKN